MDVEGYEFNVLLGASKILSSNSVSAVIVESNGNGEQFGYDDNVVHTTLCNYGYIPVSYDPSKRELTKLSDSEIKSVGNTIYVKDYDATAMRCKSAPSRCVHTASGIEV